MKTKIKIVFDSSATATIYRKDLPIIIDKKENVAPWLKNQTFEDIEVIGEKPENWDTFFPAPVPAEEATPAEKTA